MWWSGNYSANGVIVTFQPKLNSGDAQVFFHHKKCNLHGLGTDRAHIVIKTMWIQIEHYFSRSRIQIEHKNPKFKCTEGLNYNVSHNANSGKIWSENFKSQYTKWFLLTLTCSKQCKS